MNSVRLEHIVGIGDVRIQKKRGVKRISLRLHSSGEVRVSQPYYVPFKAGIIFAQSHSDWINKQRHKHQTLRFYDGMKISQRTILRLHYAENMRTRLHGTELAVYAPYATLDDLCGNEVILVKKAIKRAVNAEAKQLLPSRVSAISARYEFAYHTIAVKPLKARWGSCSHRRELTFNCYLMMLPWECIDYVIVHELVHTRHMNHGNVFWNEIAR